MMKLRAVGACCAAMWLLLGATWALACDPDEIKIGADRYFDYCLPKTVVGTCQTKGGNVDKCVNTACRVRAGATLREGLADCREQTTVCAGELAVPTSIITALVTCLAGAAAANPETCWVGGSVGLAAADVALTTCRVKYGRCIEPVLKQQKDFNTYCDRYRAAR
jgi:hypothetical protein